MYDGNLLQRRAAPMTVAAGTKPHPIFLAGRWVESPDILQIANPADPTTPAGSTYNATEAQYDEAVDAAVAAFEVTRKLPAYERSRILHEISAGIRARREELGRLIALEAGQADPRRAGRGRPGGADLPARRRGGRADDRRADPARPAALVEGPDRHHAALPDRPDRGDQPVQLPAQPGRPQGRPGDRQRQPDRAQAAVQGPADDARRGRDHRGRRCAGGLASRSCR